MDEPKLDQTTWNDVVAMPTYASLAANIRVDVCIVGAGIAGLTTARLLQDEGKTVCVLEAGEVGGGETSHTTAHFTAALDLRYFEIEKSLGSDSANLVAKSHTAAIEKTEQLIVEHRISCDHERVVGFLFADGDDRPDVLERELSAVQRAGISGVTRISKSPINSFDTGPAIRFPRQMQFHPMKYMRGLALSISRDCGKIHTNTRVKNLETRADDNVIVVKTESGFSVTSRSVVVATNLSKDDLYARLPAQATFRTYVIGLRIEKGTIPRALYWDTLVPYHYLRVESFSDAHDLILVGGEDHPSNQGEHSDRYEKLEHWVRSRFPSAQAIVHRWSGQITKTGDGLAFLGHNPSDRKNLYLISGAAGNGMTDSVIGAMLICDQIKGRKNDWIEIYNPGRKVDTKS